MSDAQLPLKPCPRCGGEAVSDEAISFRTEWGKGIHCDDCGYWTGDEMGLADAIEWWNRQPLIDKLHGRIAELEAQLADSQPAAPQPQPTDVPDDVREAIESLRALVVVYVAMVGNGDSASEHYMNAAKIVREWLDNLQQRPQEAE